MKKIFLSVVVIFFAINSCFANDGFTQLEERLGHFHSMKANFQQQIYDNYGNSLSYTTGSVAIERPGKFRWYTKSPTEQLILSDGRKVWIYDIDLEQATIQRFEPSSESLPALLLTGTTQDLQDKFNVAISRANKREIFSLTPIAPGNDNLFQQVELYFMNNKIDRMRFQDSLGQQTELSFSSVKINPTINSNQFQFKAPQGVDVIDNS